MEFAPDEVGNHDDEYVAACTIFAAPVNGAQFEVAGLAHAEPSFDAQPWAHFKFVDLFLDAFDATAPPRALLKDPCYNLPQRQLSLPPS